MFLEFFSPMLLTYFRVALLKQIFYGLIMPKNI